MFSLGLFSWAISSAVGDDMTVQSGNGWWYGNLWMRKASSLFEMPPKISQSVWVKNYCTWNKITKWFSRFQRNMTSQYVVFLCRLKWDLPNQQNCVRTNSWVHRIQVMIWGWNLMLHFILIWCFSKLGTLWWTNIAIENGHRNSGFSH